MNTKIAAATAILRVLTTFTKFIVARSGPNFPTVRVVNEMSIFRRLAYWRSCRRGERRKWR